MLREPRLMRRMKYVQRRANRYEFRFPIPDELAGRPAPAPWPERLASLVNGRTGQFKTELIRSLKTTDARVAERRALAHIAEAHALVDEASQTLAQGPPAGITPEQIAELALGHEREMLAQDEMLRVNGIGLDLAHGTIRPDGSGLTDDDLGAYRFLIEFLNADARVDAAKMRPAEPLRQFVNRAIERRGIVLHPDDPRMAGAGACIP